MTEFTNKRRTADNHYLQYTAIGKQGEYVVRQINPDEWIAIQLWGFLPGRILGTGETKEIAFKKAEEVCNV